MSQHSTQTCDSALQQRLAEVLDEYLCSVEQGEPIDLEVLIQRHPDLEDPLREYLPSLAWLRDEFGDFQAESNCADDAAQQALPPRQLGDYELLREIGRGGMGVVYEAKQGSLDRHVALKVLPFAAVLDRKQILRFQNEARAAAQLHHPNIVPIHGVGSDRGVHYYAMQFIDGQSLRQAIDELHHQTMPRHQRTGSHNGRPADTVELRSLTHQANGTGQRLNRANHYGSTARLGQQAAEAIQAAHDCGVIHRDIKPSNLLLDEQGKLWITDFGLARSQIGANVTVSGDVIGTLHYMSPEQAKGNSAFVDHRCDIYALGVTLYELLTFHRPFSGKTHADVLRQIELGDHKSLRHRDASIPRDLANVVAKAMASSRDDRYATAQELADDLGRFLAGKPTHAQPPTTTQRVGKWARRHQRSVLAAAVVGLVAITSLIAGIILLAHETSIKNAALTEARRNDQLARQRLQLATENLEEARLAVDQLGSKAAELLGSVPGTEHARHEVLTWVLKHHERLLRQQDDAAQLQVDKAVTHAKIAKIKEQLGDDSQALIYYEQAREILSDLAADPAAAPLATIRLARCLNNLGLLHARQDEPTKARDQLKQAITLQTQLVDRHPERIDLAVDLALSWNNRGLIEANAGKDQAANDAYKTGLTLLTKTNDQTIEKAEQLQTLATIYRNLSVLAAKQNVDAAIAWGNQALSIQKRLVESEPSNLQFKADLAGGYASLATFYSKLPSANTPQLIRAYDAAAQAQQELLTLQPFRLDRCRDLAITLNNRGLAQTRQERTDAARDSFQQAIELQSGLVKRLPSDVSVTHQLGGMHNNLGMVYELQRQDVLAADAYRTAIRLQMYAYHHAPQANRFRDHLSRSYFNYGRTLRRMNQPHRAAAVAMKRRELWPGDPNQLFSVAEELAITSQRLELSNGERTDDYKRQVLTTVKLAVDNGWTPQPGIRDTAVYELLKSDPEFDELMTAMQVSSSLELDHNAKRDQS